MGKASRANIAAFVHAIGDRANREVLDAVEASRQAGEGLHLRHRIEHVQILHPDDIPRLARLGVVASMQPIHAAVTRRRADGSPGPDGWYPGQRLTVAEAVYAYTAGAAYASGEEAIKGTLSPGKLADLAVLSQDVFAVEPTAVLETEVVATLFDGELVYAREGAL